MKYPNVPEESSSLHPKIEKINAASVSYLETLSPNDQANEFINTLLTNIYDRADNVKEGDHLSGQYLVTQKLRVDIAEFI